MTEQQTWRVDLRVPADSELDDAGDTLTGDVREDQTVLGAARSIGLWLPADCQQGWCITCAGRLLEGEVNLDGARRYYPEDEDAGFVLTCVAKPRSDLVLEVDRYEEMAERTHVSRDRRGVSGTDRNR